MPSRNSPRSIGSSRRWWTSVALVFIVQLILIVVLSWTRPLPQVQRPPVPGFILAEDGLADRLELTDPTLFAMPSSRSFSGLAWFRVPEHPIPAFDWSAPPEFLPLPAEPVSELFNRFVQTTNPPAFSVPSQSALHPALPEMSFPPDPAQPSVLRIEGALASRRLLSDPELRSLRPPDQTDFLTNTIVLLSVDGAGIPFSWTLIGPGSGSAEADQTALALTRAIRFQPLGPADQAATRPSNLTWGKLIFEWN